MSKIRLNQVKLPIFYLFLTYKRQYYMVQPFRFFFLLNFFNFKEMSFAFNFVFKNAVIIRFPLLQCLTIDKIPFHKIFKKLLQTVKTMVLFYTAFQF